MFFVHSFESVDSIGTCNEFHKIYREALRGKPSTCRVRCTRHFTKMPVGYISAKKPHNFLQNDGVNRLYSKMQRLR